MVLLDHKIFTIVYSLSNKNKAVSATMFALSGYFLVACCCVGQKHALSF